MVIRQLIANEAVEDVKYYARRTQQLMNLAKIGVHADVAGAGAKGPDGPPPAIAGGLGATHAIDSPAAIATAVAAVTATPVAAIIAAAGPLVITAAPTAAIVPAVAAPTATMAGPTAGPARAPVPGLGQPNIPEPLNDPEALQVAIEGALAMANQPLPVLPDGKLVSFKAGPVSRRSSPQCRTRAMNLARGVLSGGVACNKSRVPQIPAVLTKEERVRSEQNQRAYTQRNGDHPSPFFPAPGIFLPPDLLEHAHKPSIVGGRQQTAIDLGLWAPPYTFNPAGLQKESKGSPSTEHEHLNVSEEAHLKLGQVSELERRCLTRALGSRQFTLLVEAGRQRLEIWDEKENIQDQILAMKRELTVRTRAWVDLHGASWEDSRVTTGHDVALDWG
ncbi:hypothetical protein BKA93DRAFT_750821 [Sparassis latifolia]